MWSQADAPVQTKHLPSCSEKESPISPPSMRQSRDDFEDAYNKVACLIAKSISDKEILSVTAVLEDPVATWEMLDSG